MKTSRTLFLIVLLSVTTLLSAQEGKFGYIDFNGTLKLMPEYMEAQIILLKTQFLILFQTHLRIISLLQFQKKLQQQILLKPQQQPLNQLII